MNKLKLFLQNFIVYGFGGIISKAIPLVMLPIITRLMPDSSYYGLSDLANTAVQFGTALATMGMYDAVFRMFFEKESIEYQKRLCSTALLFTFFISIIVSLLLVIFRNKLAVLFFGDIEYLRLVYIVAFTILVGATNNIVMIPTRTQNKSKTYILINTFAAVVSYSISIPLLLKGYYLFALPIAAFLSMLLTELAFFGVNRKWFSFAAFDITLLKPLLQIAVPLLPNFLVYWIFNSSDRLMIAKLIGNNYTGIYSVSSKLGHISQLIYTAFAGGWQYFAFSTMKEKDQVKSNSTVYEYLGVISFGISVIVFAMSYVVFAILFEEEYMSGYVAAPYLFLAPLLQMLFQVACNQFLVIKKTGPNLFILSFGAVLNIILNFLLIPRIGIEGAAIATLLGYVAANIICVWILIKTNLMVVSKRFILVAILLFIYILIWGSILKKYLFAGIVGALVYVGICFGLYKEDCKHLLIQVKKK